MSTLRLGGPSSTASTRHVRDGSLATNTILRSQTSYDLRHNQLLVKPYQRVSVMNKTSTIVWTDVHLFVMRMNVSGRRLNKRVRKNPPDRLPRIFDIEPVTTDRVTVRVAYHVRIPWRVLRGRRVTFIPSRRERCVFADGNDNARRPRRSGNKNDWLPTRHSRRARRSVTSSQTRPTRGVGGGAAMVW